MGGERRDPSEDGRVRAWGVGEPEFVLVPFVAHLALQVGVVWEGELDRRDRPGGAVNEERTGSQEGCLVWYGRDVLAFVNFLLVDDIVLMGVREGLSLIWSVMVCQWSVGYEDGAGNVRSQRDEGAGGGTMGAEEDPVGRRP